MDEMDELLHEDWLDARLRDEAPYIDDAGFTAAILQKLPARAPRRSFRSVILFAITFVACLAAYLISDRGRFLIVAAERLAAMPFGYICAVALLCTVVITAVGAGAAFFTANDRPLDGLVRLFR
jgi:hypothetical protein